MNPPHAKDRETDKVYLHDKFTRGLINLGLDPEQVKKEWFYCGANYSSGKNYWSIFWKEHTQEPLKPKQRENCICGHVISKDRNAYITDITTEQILVIGSCCKNQFINKGGRLCSVCEKTHRNIKVNRCNECKKLCIQCNEKDCNWCRDFYFYLLEVIDEITEVICRQDWGYDKLIDVRTHLWNNPNSRKITKRQFGLLKWLYNHHLQKKIKNNKKYQKYIIPDFCIKLT